MTLALLQSDDNDCDDKSNDGLEILWNDPHWKKITFCSPDLFEQEYPHFMVPFQLCKSQSSLLHSSQISSSILCKQLIVYHMQAFKSSIIVPITNFLYFAANSVNV